MELNKIQIKMMRDIENGVTELPKTHAEYYGHVSAILLAVDVESIEKPFLNKCRDQIVRTYFKRTKGKVNENIYLSQLKNQLSRRNYFNTFQTICANRNSDAFKESYRSLIEDGYAKSDGLFFRMNESAKELIK